MPESKGIVIARPVGDEKPNQKEYRYLLGEDGLPLRFPNIPEAENYLHQHQIWGENIREMGLAFEGTEVSQEEFDSYIASLPYLSAILENGERIFLKEQPAEAEGLLCKDMAGKVYSRDGDALIPWPDGRGAAGRIENGNLFPHLSDGQASLPEKGTPELAAMALADMVKLGALKPDRHLDSFGKRYDAFLSLPTVDGHMYGQKDYSAIPSLPLEDLRGSLSKAFQKDPDLFLDISHAGSLLLPDGTIFTNDTLDHIERKLDEIMEFPSTISYYIDDAAAEDFCRDVLGERFEDKEFQGVREACEQDDISSAAKALLEAADEELLGRFRSTMESELDRNYPEFVGESVEGEREDANECLESYGFLKETESCLFFGGPTNWRGNSGAKLEDVNDFSDIEDALAPDSDYTMTVKAVPGLPYFEAMVYSHDVPTGGHFYILPESQWDLVEGRDSKTGEKGQGYQFLADAIQENELVGNIFRSRDAMRRLDKAAETNPAARLFAEEFHSCLGNYFDETTADFYNKWWLDDVVGNACENLAEHPEVLANPEPFAKVIEEFNPALYKEGEGRDWLMKCVERARASRRHALDRIPKDDEGKFFPETHNELVDLVENESVHLGNINTSRITDMSNLFSTYNERTDEYDLPERRDFSGIETWDTSHVTSMHSMFAGCASFNGDISRWNVSQVEDMSNMFDEAISFNQPLNSWDVARTKYMQGMFERAESFNQPLDQWDVSSVESMSCMFAEARSFNQPLDKWNVVKVTNADFMMDDTDSLDKKNLKKTAEAWKKRNKACTAVLRKALKDMEASAGR